MKVYKNKTDFREFLGGPVTGTWRFHCLGPGFDPWSGTGDPAGFAQRPKKKTDFNNSTTHKQFRQGEGALTLFTSNVRSIINYGYKQENQIT